MFVNNGTDDASVLQFSNEDVINVFHNEPELWNTELNATQEAEELARRRMCDVFGLKSAGKYGLA